MKTHRLKSLIVLAGLFFHAQAQAAPVNLDVTALLASIAGASSQTNATVLNPTQVNRLASLSAEKLLGQALVGVGLPVVGRLDVDTQMLISSGLLSGLTPAPAQTNVWLSLIDTSQPKTKTVSESASSAEDMAFTQDTHEFAPPDFL
jgi:hypothetical protein